MKKFIYTFVVVLFIPFLTYSQKPKLTGFNNFTKWVDRGLKDNAVSAREIMNLDQFVLSENGNFKFLVMLPPPDKLVYLKYKAPPSQRFQIMAKDNDTGEEWKIIESYCRRDKINLIKIKPIKGNITLTCTYLDSEVDRALEYSYLPENKDPYQHLYYYLNKDQIDQYSTFTPEQITKFKELKTLKLLFTINIDQVSGLNLPVQETVTELIKNTGLEMAKGSDTADITVYFNIYGNSIFSDVEIWQDGYNITATISKEIQLEGSILFKTKDDDLLASNFYRHKMFNRLDFDRRNNQLYSQIFYGYRNLYKLDPIIKEFSGMLIHALEIDPVEYYINLTKNKNEIIGNIAIGLIGNYQTPEAFDFLVGIYQNETDKKKSLILKTLSQMHTKEALDFIIESFNDKNSTNRLQISSVLFNSLIEMEDERTMDIISEAFRSDPDAIKVQAARALGKIGDKECVNLLLNDLNDSPEQVAESIVIALGNTKDKEATKPLIQYLNSLNTKKEWKKYIRNKLTGLTIQALGDIGSSETFPIILTYFKNNNFKRRVHDALVNISGVDKGYKYKDWFNWWNENN